MAKWTCCDVTVTSESGEQSTRPGQTTPAVPGLAVTEVWDEVGATGRYVITHLASGESLLAFRPLRGARAKLLTLAGYVDWTLPKTELEPILTAKGWRKH